MAQLQIIVHNIRSAENVGSILRTADSLGVSGVWLTGYSPGIDHPKVKKTALGAEKSMTIKSETNVTKVIDALKKKGCKIIGLELDPKAEPLASYKTKSNDKIALLLGNEVEGIASYLRELCDDLVFIEQKGVKESMNVSVATGIACWHLLLK